MIQISCDVHMMEENENIAFDSFSTMEVEVEFDLVILFSNVPRSILWQVII